MLLHYLETLTSAKQAINDRLQGSVATYLRCGGVVNNQIKNTRSSDAQSGNTGDECSVFSLLRIHIAMIGSVYSRNPPPQKKLTTPETAAKLCALNLFFGRDNELQSKISQISQKLSFNGR